MSNAVFTANDPLIMFSPFNWDVTSVRAKTINPGAYFKFVVSGSATGITLNFDMTAASTPLPVIKYRVDDGGWQRVTYAASVDLAIPTTNSWTDHYVEVVVAATSEFVNRWNPQNAHVSLTSISVVATDTPVLKSVSRAAKNILVYGDSIVEGYKTNLNTTDPIGSDATVGWAFILGELLGAEVGVVGFGGTRFTGNGQGGVPGLQDSYALQWGGGPARSFTSPVPDVIVICSGHNEGTTDVTAVTTLLSGMLTQLLTKVPATTQILVIRPLANRQAAPLQEAVRLAGTSRVKYISSDGWWTTADALDGVHPVGVINQRQVAPKMAEAIRKATNVNRYLNVGGSAKPLSPTRL